MPEMSLSDWYKSGGHLPEEKVSQIPDTPKFGMRDIFAMSGMPTEKADALAKQYNNKEDTNFAIGGSATKSMGKNLVRIINEALKSQKAAIKAGDTATALAKQNELKEAIKATVNSPALPRAKPLSDAQIQEFAERMAPQITGELTRGEKGASTIAGKTQQQFQREKTLPVDRTVLQGAKDPMAPLPEMTLEQQKGGVLLGLPGDPTLARMQLSGIGDVAFERPVTLHGGPRYGDDEKLWASNIAGASNLVGAGRRASEQYGGAPVYASFMKMPEGFGFAHHYLDSLLQYTRPDQLPKAARLALEEDIRKGFVKGNKKYEFPEFAGFSDLETASQQALADSNLRKHIADRLEKSKIYNLRPAGDVQFAVTHPELTNIETGAGGFTIGELPLNQPFSASAHPTYTHDIPGKVLGQTRNPTPYDLLYRDQLEMVKKNPAIADDPFNTTKLLGARQKIDEQLINEINEYQERLRRLTGKKEGGVVHMGKGGILKKGAQAIEEAYKAAKAAEAIADAKKLLAKPREGVWNGEGTLSDWRAKQQARMAEESKAQAPAVIIPSKLSNVEQAIRQSKGEYGAKRVQRAADEVKNLEQQYTEEALRQAFGGDNATALMIGNPAEFQKYAAELEDPYRAAIESYIQRMSLGGGGADDVPFLELNKDEMRLPFVSGHEGRHRNLALEEMGDENTLWRMLPRAALREPLPRRSQEEYLQALIERIGQEPLVIPEGRFTDEEKRIRDWAEARKLPKLFAGGGLAMAEGGQAFPLQDEFQAEMERRRKRPRNRAGVPVDDTNVIGGAATGLMNTLAGGLRGRVIGTLGVPGDIVEGMSDLEGALPVMERKAKGQTFPQTYKAPAPFKLPTMEDLDRMLPSAGDSQEAKIAQQLGEFMPITGSELAPAGRAMVSGAKKAGTALTPALADMMEAELRKSGMIQDIIKPKGGNWLNDSSGFVPRRVKSNTTNWNPEDVVEGSAAANSPSVQRDLAVGKWIDKKLHPYIKNEMGTAEDPIRLGIERRAAEAEKLKEANQARLAKMEADIERAKAAGKDTTLSEGDLEKAREKFADEEYIASQGLFHKTIPEGGWTYNRGLDPQYLERKRSNAGMPTEGLATHPAAQRWESAVDREIEATKASTLLENEHASSHNPWLAKLDPNTQVYNLDSFSDSTFEFRHMIDELKEAMDPASILPKHLRIAVKDLEKMTIDDASALSGKISAWRNVQKTKSDLQIANNPATHTFKEYPLDESNPKGVSWRQIKRPEGYSEEEAEKFVRDATRYEGEIMRHCVGGAGHCEPLLRGEVELYTLRDVKGEPHVTIEVEPAQKPYPASGEEFAMLDSATKAKYSHYVREWRQRNPEINNLTDENVYQALKEAGVPPKPPKILEIKGKNNRKPSPEYIPFVQDFIKSGKWAEIGDIQNSDLYRLDKDWLGQISNFLPEAKDIQHLSKVQREEALEKALDSGEFPSPSYLTRSEWENAIRKYSQFPSQERAYGGAIRMAQGGSAKSSKALSEWYLSGGHLPR